MENATYKSAGIDLDVYQESMKRLPKLMNRTLSPRAMRMEGGFAGLFQLDFNNPLFRRNYVDPVLVSCTDGVGTKLKVAMMADRHNSVGIDLVAMSVNDAICCGAELLFFLDYVAMSHDDPERLEQIVEGISDGCVQAGCALIGGETAIMPDLYARGEYDLAGFCVGVAEKKHLITGDAIAPNDVILGIGSSGFHSNGYSLIRKVVFDDAGLSIHDRVDLLDCTVAEALLKPTQIYTQVVRKVLNHYKVKNVVHGIAHITGGGLQENIDRILNDGVQAELDLQSWPMPKVFSWVQELGSVELDEMFRVFNMGIGMALIVSDYFAANVQKMVIDSGLDCWKIGIVSQRKA